MFWKSPIWKNVIFQYRTARWTKSQGTWQKPYSHFVYCLVWFSFDFSESWYPLFLLTLVSFSNLIKRNQHLLTAFLFKCVVLKTNEWKYLIANHQHSNSQRVIKQMKEAGVAVIGSSHFLDCMEEKLIYIKIILAA